MKGFVRILGATLCAAPAALLGGCGGKASMPMEVGVAAPPSVPFAGNTDDGWRRVATEEDRTRLRNWRQAWLDALAKVKASDQASLIEGDSTLFDPDRALPDATLPVGNYQCRVIKLGANGVAMRDVTLYPPVECKVRQDGDATTLYKVSGVQRPVGMLFRETPARTIFLGTMVFGDETKPLRYGLDTNRDLAGYIERIGDRRWRLVLPYPRFESLLDVVEITPAAR